MAVIKEKILINDEYLKVYSPIPLNYNLDEVRPYVKVSELLYIEPILGEPLYEELIEQVASGDITEVNSTLLLQIYPALAIGTAFEALPFIWSHMSEVGITKGHSDNSDSIDLKDLNYLSQHLKAQLQARLDNLEYFLKTHLDSYPLYVVVDDCCVNKNRITFNQLYSPRKKDYNIR